MSHRKLILHWGNHAIALVRLPGTPEDHGVSMDNPIRLVEVDGFVETELERIANDHGRKIDEYLIDRRYWVTNDEPFCTVPQLHDRPDWAYELMRKLFRLIDAGDLMGAKNLMSEIEERVGIDDPDLAKAEVLMRHKQILGK